MQWLLVKVVLCTLPALLFVPGTSQAKPETKVFINGEPMSVFFNDGDSFRVLSGCRKGAKARIAGYNTLESHGPVHSWGRWTTKEMHVLAKMATLHARRGVWKCQTDGKTDFYGRMLTFCPGLGKELIRLGLAHAMSISDKPANPKFLRAQRQAMQARSGIWKQGIPAFIVTSIHSANENISSRSTYNRLVSTADGHTVKWRHRDHYSECTSVCQRVFDITDQEIARMLKAASADSATKPILQRMTPAKRTAAIRDYGRYRHAARVVPKKHRQTFKKTLDRINKQQRIFTGKENNQGSCMVHVPFNRRFGGTRAECLR